MICFTLHCGNEHTFEGWFRDGAAYERQVLEGDVSCPTCGDRSVRKAMMAPAVVRSGSRDPVPAPAPETSTPVAPMPDEVKAAFAMALMRRLRAHVVEYFETVGERFPEEARRIHYGDAEEREIYGRATLDEAKELVEEGISVRPLPDVPELDG
ncbi:MAG: DUF1178 family protein [Geminicoccaceae bacterium]